MNLKHGDIITLENGDTVKVSLEVISKKITELIPNKIYRLKRQGEMFCHAYHLGINLSMKAIEEGTWEYIGKAEPNKYVFKEICKASYSLWGDTNLDFVIKEIK